MRGHWAFSDLRRTHLSRLSTGLRREQLRQPPQVDHHGGERDEQLDARQTPQLHLSQRAVLLGIAEHSVDQLAGDLAQVMLRSAGLDHEAIAVLGEHVTHVSRH